MRHLLAVALTTFPTAIVGRRWVGGREPFRSALGSLIGIAVLSWGAMIGGLLGSVMPGAGLALVAAWFVGPTIRRHASRDSGEHSRTVAGAALIVLAIGAVLLTMSFWRPVPRWDGWAIWSLKAKAIASSDGFHNPVFLSPTYAYSHQDYPPLLSAWQAVAYRISDDLTVSYPTQVQLAWLWTAGSLAILGFAARWRSQSRLMILAWAVAPQVLREALSGYADVPMALFLVAGAAAFVTAEETDAGAIPAAVLLAGASLIKSEGALYTAAFLIPFLFIRTYRRRAVIVGAAAAAALAPWIVFTRVHGLVSDFFHQRPGAAPVADTIDPLARLPQVLSAVGRQIVRPSAWAILVPVCVLVVLWLRPGTGPLLVAAGAVFAALVAVYLVTPYDLAWHLSRSVDRIVIGPLGLVALAAARAGQRASTEPP